MGMAIRIERVSGGYAANASPPHAQNDWQTEKPLTIAELDAELRRLGCHQTDIGDAFCEADPEWVERSAG